MYSFNISYKRRNYSTFPIFFQVCRNVRKKRGILLQFGAFYTIMDVTFFRENDTYEKGERNMKKIVSIILALTLCASACIMMSG